MSRPKERVFGIWEVPPIVSDLLGSLSERSRALFRLPDDAARGDLVALAQLILSRRGEVSGAILAESMVRAYHDATPEARDTFMVALLERFGPNADEVEAAAQAYLADPVPARAGHLHTVAEPRRQELFRRINVAPGGTATLVHMREHLLDMLAEQPSLRAVDEDFCHLFGSWFNRGFLGLRQIDWKTPANILEMLIRYEAVHEIQGWDDLRRRIQPADRRCYAFFHPQLEDEPLIFVEVALTDGVSGSIGSLLSETREPMDPGSANTAVFYSISNCQRGLAGVSLGNFLIKQVVEELKRELPRLENFVTLSPIPGFSGWLRRAAHQEGEVARLAKQALSPQEGEGGDAGVSVRAGGDAQLTALAAHYLLEVKRGDGRPVDSVARFHLGNGAMVERLNPLADRSPRGIAQSLGMMVNYRYRPDDIEKNHETYAETGKVAAAPAMRKMAQQIRLEVN